MSLTDLAPPAVVAAVTAAVVAPLVRGAARRLGAVSLPSADRWNARAVPLLGGVALWIGTLAGLAAGAWISADVLLVVGAGTAMFGLGLLDDFVRLKPMTKLIWQVVTACAAVIALAPPPLTGSPIADALLSIAWIVAVTNAVNLLDNMDGLCAGVASIGAFALAMSLEPGASAFQVLALALAGAAAGFLVHNFHPASLFMGDSGSLFLGSTLALAALHAGRQERAGLLSAIAVPVVLLLIPLFDTLFVTVLRKLSARAASAGGRDHTSHRLVALGFSEPRAVLLLYALAAAAGAAAVLMHSHRREALLLTAVLVVGLVLIGVRLARVNVYGDEAFSALRDRSITPLLADLAYKRRVFEVLLDSCLICLAYYAAYVVRFDDQFGLYYGLLVQSLPVVLACGLAGLYIAGVYRGIWRYISLDDLPTYGRGLIFGGLTPVFVLVYLYRFEGYPRSVFVLHTLLLGALMLGSRIGFRALGELAHRHSASGGTPALVYGAGDRGALLAREIRSHRSPQYRILGFIDDDPSKANRGIHGVRVLGGGDQLREILARTGAEIVIVSTTLRPPARLALLSACQESGTAVVQFEFRLDPVDPSLVGQ